jgi:hypothetical protein
MNGDSTSQSPAMAISQESQTPVTRAQTAVMKAATATITPTITALLVGFVIVENLRTKGDIINHSPAKKASQESHIDVSSVLSILLTPFQ